MKYCLACLLLLSVSIFGVMSEEELNKNKISELVALAKNKNYSAVWQLAEYYRTNNDLKSAEELLKKYTSPIGFDQIPQKDSVDYLKCLLEAAHLKALKNDVPGALALLSWAEGRKNDFQRAVSCLKYAEILLDLGEFERADSYLKNVSEITAKNIKEENTVGAALGQGGETIDTGAAWRELRDEAFLLSTDIEAEQLKKKFGESYSLYVKLRRMQNIAKRSKVPRYQKEALKLADEIIATDPASQFAAAAGYLKGEIMKDKLTNKSSPEGIKDVKVYLEKFVKAQPDGLYHGEALMLLGKISLEYEWNAKDAEKYYSQALDYFQKSREKRDAVSLYAAMSDDLKKQTTPVQKPTTLNQWKRIEYHDEDPLKLYNTANAPVWYASDKEKNCIFALGFISFTDDKYDIAKNYWSKVLDYSPDIAALDQRLPNVQTRLLQACDLHAMAFWPEEKAGIKDRNTRLKLQHAEYLILIERHGDAIELFKSIAEKGDELTKALGYMGIATATDLEFKEGCKQVSEKYCQWILEHKKLQKEPIYGKALLFSGDLKMSRNDLEAQAVPFFVQYIDMFEKGHEIRRAKYRLAQCYLKLGELAKTEKLYNELKSKDDMYSEFLLSKIESYKNKGEVKK